MISPENEEGKFVRWCSMLEGLSVGTERAGGTPEICLVVKGRHRKKESTGPLTGS